ncbi:diguanylate cyclase [Lysinibacillus sp. KU-BSD001]|uniref:tetratricopeptide repeat-containing diguanylate cyclase n=1 Tax=Lysinibacillus sp. KU-BSD001 TaxID=3141328 RepID=UPI0036E6BD4D
MSIKYKPVPHVESHYDQLFADGHYHGAIDVMCTFLEEFEQHNNPYGAMIAHINIASCYYCLGQMENAFQSTLQYKQLCDEYGSPHEHYNLCHIYALIYEYEQHYDKAKKATEECIRLAQMLNLPYELSKSYRMMSNFHLVTEHYEEALTMAQEALAIAKTHCAEEVRLHCQIYCSLAIAYVHLERFTDVAQILELLSPNPFIQSNQRERSYYLYTKGLLALKQERLTEAITYLSEAEIIALSTNNYVLLKRIYFYHAQAYEQQQCFKNAYEYMKKHADMLKQVYKGRLFSKVRELDIEHSISTMEQRANMDPLSGVYTRHYLESTCDHWLTEARETSDHICCLVFDVDNFKSINDYYGHLVGDEVIAAVGQQCRKIVQEEQTLIGRYGGDEFVILLKNFSQQQIANKVNDIFNALTNMTVSGEGYNVQFTISMGVVCNSSVIARKFKQLFRIADQALYMAKSQGKNQVVSLSHMNHPYA